MTAPDPNAPGDGVWRVARPEQYVAGLYRLHQIEARWLLKLAVGLTNWDAVLLQNLAYQHRDLSDLQAHWLRKLVRTYERRAA